MIASVSLHYIAGNEVKLGFTVTRDGEPVSLAGMRIRFVIAGNAGPVVGTEDGTATVDATDAVNGHYTVTVDSANTAELLGTYRFQSDIEDAKGGVATVARGFITFSRNLFAAAS